MANAWHLEIIYTFFVPIVTSMSAIVLQRCACARAHTYDIDWQFWIQYIQSNIRTYRRATKRTHTRGREEERCTISWSYRNYSSLALVSSLFFFFSFVLSVLSAHHIHSIYISVYNIGVAGFFTTLSSQWRIVSRIKLVLILLIYTKVQSTSSDINI